MSDWIDGIEIITTAGLIRHANVAPECYAMINDPEGLIQSIVGAGSGADIVTFGQRLPDLAPRHHYHLEWEQVAAMRITSYQQWLEEKLSKDNRKNVGKAARKGISVREADFNDDFVNGIVDIYNETPVRQGKRFTHYGKDFLTVKRDNGTYLGRSVFIGAYYQDALVGFVKLVLDDKCASTQQVISKIEHRDKKTTNALLAKSVEICASRGIQYLQYGVWSDGGLGEFKIHNGFEKVMLPKYFVPVTLKGRIALGLNLHHGTKQFLPPNLLELMRGARRRWYERK